MVDRLRAIQAIREVLIQQRNPEPGEFATLNQLTTEDLRFAVTTTATLVDIVVRTAGYPVEATDPALNDALEMLAAAEVDRLLDE